VKAIIAGRAAIALTAPAFAQGTDTLSEVTTKGLVIDPGGMNIEVTYKPDGTFTAMDGAITGKWRIDGEKLCATTDATPEDCVVYPKGKKSGDTFEVTGAMGTGPVKIK
jgi:hypothetical protein